MEFNHSAELLSIESSNKITSHERLVEARGNWEHEQKKKMREMEMKMENERRAERNRLLEMVNRVEETRARVEAELDEEGRRIEDVAEEKQTREKLEENLSRFRMGMKATLGNMERERIERETEETERERARAEEEEETVRRIEELTRQLEEEKAAKEEWSGWWEEEWEEKKELTGRLEEKKAENEHLKMELEKLKAEIVQPRESRDQEAEENPASGPKESLCENDIDMFNSEEWNDENGAEQRKRGDQKNNFLSGMERNNKPGSSTATWTRESTEKLDEDANVLISTTEEVPRRRGSKLMEADLAESRRIIAAEVIRKLIDKVEILESLQSTSSQQVTSRYSRRLPSYDRLPRVKTISFRQSSF